VFACPLPMMAGVRAAYGEGSVLRHKCRTTWTIIDNFATRGVQQSTCKCLASCLCAVNLQCSTRMFLTTKSHNKRCFGDGQFGPQDRGPKSCKMCFTGGVPFCRCLCVMRVHMYSTWLLVRKLCRL